MMFNKSALDHAINFKPDMSEVKEYPGSLAGPNPEDDPQHYSKWFVEN